MTIALFVLLAALGGTLVARPLLASRAAAWPLEPDGEGDDVARAVSSLRDLEFAKAAGTIDPADYARLRERLERSAFAPAPLPSGAAPLRTFVIAALIAGVATVLVTASLPRAVGDRAPGTTLTGSVPRSAPSIGDLEARARADPKDIPTRLALAEEYAQAGRGTDAVASYQSVLSLDSNNVPALDGLAIILAQNGERAGAMVAVERVLAQRPRDADALFLKGLLFYQEQRWADAVDVWSVYLDVGEFHPAAGMVRPLYAEALRKLGR